jgi:uncharacterized membrane protein
MNAPDIAVNDKETGRVEAFSDGVFAIAITLLVLDLKVPRVETLPAGTSLAYALLRQWPVFLAFVTSFLTILIMWINHHRLFVHIRRSNRPFLILNGLLLLLVTFVPFPTSLVAEYLEHTQARTAAAVYSGTFILIAILFNLLWRYAKGRGGHLLAPNHDRADVEAITRQYRFGPLMYVVAFLLAFLSAPLSFGLCLLLAIYFALPGRPQTRPAV